MASASETGHAKNAALFESLISFCAGYGASYNPSKAEIHMAALTALQTRALNSIGALNASKTAWTNASNVRRAAFAPLKKLCTQVINALDATASADKLLASDAKSINHKIQGRRVRDKPAPPAADHAAAEDKTISVFQQSCNSLIENFAKLIELLRAEPTYAPNEADLQVSALIATLERLRAANTAVINAYANYNNAIIARNAILYGVPGGLAEIASDVKKYVKSVFGATSPQFKQVRKLAFRKVR